MTARQNYQVEAYIGQTTKMMSRFTPVLDTGAGASFIRKSVIPESMLPKIKYNLQRMDIRDANNRRVKLDGVINLQVRLGNRIETVHFNIVEKLGTGVILGFDYLDKHVEAIRPRRRVVELADGTTIPIMKRILGRGKQPDLLPEEKEFVPMKGRLNQKILVTNKKTLYPNTQTWVEVTTSQHGLILIEPLAKLYDSHVCLTGNGIAQVESGIPFQILIGNFSDKERCLLPNQQVATAKPHPTTIVESDITHAELLGLTIEDTSKDVSKKINLNHRTVNAI